MRETIQSSTLSDAVDAFLLAKRVANCSSRTIGNYTDVLARFRRESQLTQIHEATVVTIQRYLTVLQQHGLRPASQFTHFLDRHLEASQAVSVKAVAGQLQLDEPPLAALTLTAPG